MPISNFSKNIKSIKGFFPQTFRTKLLVEKSKKTTSGF